MLLVDTSVWVDHFRRRNEAFAAALEHDEVAIHDAVIGELACGNLKRRAEILRLLRELPRLPLASTEEVLHLIEQRSLAGRGIGWIDAHLAAAAILGGAVIWTLDRALGDTARELGIAVI